MGTDKGGALAAIRLSRSTDESKSVERQRDVVNGWSQRQDGEPLIGEALDVDVSGSVSPFDRPDLGQWLTDSPPRPWTGLVAWKLDRISRNALDTLKLLEWLDRRDKYLVAVSDGIDTRLPMGRLFVQLAAIFAELERTFIRERILASRATVRDQGRYGGEGIPYGLMSAPRDDGPGYVLQQDPVAVRAIHGAVKMIKGGKTLADAERWFNSNNVLPPRERQREIYGKPLKGGGWSAATLARTLRKRALVEHGILSPAEYRELLAALDRRARPKERGGNNPAPLSGVVRCGECLVPLWHRAQYMPAGKNGQKTTKTYRYYYCKTTGHTRQIRAEGLEEVCREIFLAKYEGEEVTERVDVPPTDHEDEIAAAQMAVEDLSRALASARSDTARSALSRELSALDERLAELESIPTDPGGVRWVPNGRTWAEELERLDEEGQRQLWLRVGFRFAVQSTAERFAVDIQPPEELTKWYTEHRRRIHPTVERQVERRDDDD